MTLRITSRLSFKSKKRSTRWSKPGRKDCRSKSKRMRKRGRRQRWSRTNWEWSSLTWLTWMKTQPWQEKFTTVLQNWARDRSKWAAQEASQSRWSSWEAQASLTTMRSLRSMRRERFRLKQHRLTVKSWLMGSLSLEKKTCSLKLMSKY